MTAVAHKLVEQVELVPISEIARRCKIDRATCASRLDDLGYIADESSTAKRQLYPFDSEMELAIKSAKDTMSAVRIRDMRASAQIKEMKLAEQLGELVPMHDAVEMVRSIVFSIYQEFTVRQPKRIAPKLAKAKNVVAVRKVLKADTDRIMKNLRENFERFIA
jgi:hypothetical protein